MSSNPILLTPDELQLLQLLLSTLLTFIQIVVLIIIPILTLYIVYTLKTSMQKRTVVQDFVYIAFEILNTEKTDENALLHAWAVRVISAYSPVSVPSKLKEHLLSKSCVLPLSPRAYRQSPD